MSDSAKLKQYAEKIKLFNGLETSEVRDLLKLGHTLEYRAGDAIFHKGQLGSNLYIVLSGTVDIENDGYIIAKCRSGDAFGEMSVLNHRPHCASANARSDVKLFTLSEDQINKILDKKVAVRLLLNVIHVLSGQLEGANTMVVKLQKESKRSS